MFKIFTLISIFFIPSVFAQEIPKIDAQLSDKETKSDAKMTFLAAFRKMRSVPKIRIVSEANVNNKTFENTVSEYVAPNKYYRLLKKNREGEKFEFEGIEIAGQHFEKSGSKWIREPEPLIPLKIEIDEARAPRFESSKSDLFKVISFEVEYLGEEVFSGKTLNVYKYILITDFLPTEGKVWILNGLPIRQKSSTLPGCLNTIIANVEYNYEAEIIIQKPRIFQK